MTMSGRTGSWMIAGRDRLRARWLPVLLLAITLLACSQPTPITAPQPGAPQQSQPPQAAPRESRTLVVA
ncbi:MAG: hypothetical protein QOF51_3452, partial [Chloroflexota bacterium]|nr:hypothetical protein [Chloroflexota bacterium]